MQNLITVVRAIENIGKAIPNINTVVLSDIYKLNELPDIDYSVFAIIQDQHRQDDDYLYLNFYLYYVDRLLNDKSNQLEIQSTGMNLLSFVIDKMEDLGLILSPDTDRTYQSFNQKFADECAGVYARVELMVPVDCTTPFDLLVNPLLGDLSVYQPDTYYPADFGVDAFRVVTVSGQSYHYYTEEDKTAKIDNGYHNIVVNKSGVTIDGQNINNNIADLSGITSEHTTQIETISATTSGLTSDLQALSAQTSANTADISTLSAMTGDFVRKEPENIDGTSAQTIDFNDIRQTGYYYLKPHNDYAINHPSGWGWKCDGMLHVITDFETGRIVQTFYATYIAEHWWPKLWWRTYTWTESSGYTWSKWQELATNENAVMQEPRFIRWNEGDEDIDFNDYTFSGYYSFKNVYNHCVNAPVASIGDCLLNVIADHGNWSGDGDIILQECTFTGNNAKYFRTLNGATGVWSEWVKIPDQSDIVALSGTTSALSVDLQALSAQTSANTEAIATISISGVSTAVTSQLNELSGLTSANTQNIETLSGITSANTEAIATISAVTGDWMEKTPKPITYSGTTIDFNDFTTTGFYVFRNCDVSGETANYPTDSRFTGDTSNFFLYVWASQPVNEGDELMVRQQLMFTGRARPLWDRFYGLIGEGGTPAWGQWMVDL